MSILGNDHEEPLLPRAIHSHGPYCGAAGVGNIVNVSPAPASIAWPAANLGKFVPFTLPWDYPVRRVFWGNGSTLTGNGCLAIYTSDGQRIYTTGAIARSGASRLQYVSTDFILDAGKYYIGFSCGGTTTAVRGTSGYTAAICRLAGVLDQTSVGTLPADMNSVTAAATAGLPMVGITWEP